MVKDIYYGSDDGPFMDGDKVFNLYMIDAQSSILINFGN